MVYDESIRDFRKLNKSNYNDDIIWGTIFLRREALFEIGAYFYICGYVIIDKNNGNKYPIDIHKSKVVILEGTYNQMPSSLKHTLIQYNIQVLPDRIWSAFFINWKFIWDPNVFENSGDFIRLCSNILTSTKKYNRFVKLEISLFEPSTYLELCTFTRNILNLSSVDIYGSDYYKNFKYLIYSLANSYHINFSDHEITSYFYRICKLINERWKE